MKFKVNGHEHIFSSEPSVTELLIKLGKEGLPLTVFIGGVSIPKSDYSTCKIREGDSVNVITFLGGG